MSSNKRQSFLFGAMILVSANLIVKIIGFIFKIPLFNVIGDIGMGYYNAAYTIYVYFFTLSTAGLPVAISRMIAVANTQKNYEEEKRIFRLALIIFVAIGTVGMLVMLAGAKSISGAMENPYAYYSIIVIAPTLFFICITSAYRGFFQGRQNMIPTAVSEIIESLGKLIIGLTATFYAINKGYPAQVVAAYAVSGLTVGVMIGAVFLMATKFLAKKEEHDILSGAPGKSEKNMFTPTVRSRKTIVKEIIKISLPITISASLLSLSSLIDAFIMTRRLVDIGYTYINNNGELLSVTDAATGAYGSYTTMAITFFNFPNALIIPFAVSIIPAISTAYANRNTAAIQSTIESTFRMVSMIAMPSAFGISAMSGPILNMIFKDGNAVARTAPMLSILAIAIVFVAIVSVTNSVLQSQRQENKPMISMACGAAVKLAGSYILIGIPSIGRFGTPISTCLCYFTIMAVNFYFLSKNTRVIPAIKKTFIKPFISSAVTGVTAILSYRLLCIAINSKIATLAAIAVAALVYVIMLFALKTLTREDVLLLPKGTKIYESLKKFNLIA